MTENDEKLAEEKAFEFDDSLIENKAYPFDEQLVYGYKHGFLAGIAHEKKRMQAEIDRMKKTIEYWEDFATGANLSCICSPNTPSDFCPKHPRDPLEGM